MASNETPDAQPFETVEELEMFVGFSLYSGGDVTLRRSAYDRLVATAREKFADGATERVQLTTQLRALVVRCEEEITAERMGEPSANAQAAFDALIAALPRAAAPSQGAVNADTRLLDTEVTLVHPPTGAPLTLTWRQIIASCKSGPSLPAPSQGAGDAELLRIADGIEEVVALFPCVGDGTEARTITLDENDGQWLWNAVTSLRRLASRVSADTGERKDGAKLCERRFEHVTAPHKISRGVVQSLCELPRGHEGPCGLQLDVRAPRVSHEGAEPPNAVSAAHQEVAEDE